MRTIHLSATDAVAKQIGVVAFPSYCGRKFKAVIVKVGHTFNLTSGWDGGSKDFYAIVRLIDMKAVELSDTKVVGNNFNTIGQDFQLPEGFVLVEQSFFCGKDTGLTIYVTEANATKLIPAPIELSKEEKAVLVATRSFKSSYAGIKNYRQQESGLSLSVWEAASETLKAKGLLAKNGAITPEGRNAI